MKWICQLFIKYPQQLYSIVSALVSNILYPPFRVFFIDEYLPKQLKRRAIYVVQEDGYQEQVAMICPCGCGSILHMNLLPDERPRWRLTQHKDGTVSLYPSVWRKKGCNSHFWFRHGRVQWCRQKNDSSKSSRA